MFEEFSRLLIKHMMRSVNDRYAILNRLVKNERFLSELNVEGPASMVGSELAGKIKKWFGENQVEYFLDRLKEIELPEWMNDK